MYDDPVAGTWHMQPRIGEMWVWALVTTLYDDGGPHGPSARSEMVRVCAYQRGCADTREDIADTLLPALASAVSSTVRMHRVITGAAGRRVAISLLVDDIRDAGRGCVTTSCGLGVHDVLPAGGGVMSAMVAVAGVAVDAVRDAILDVG